MRPLREMDVTDVAAVFTDIDDTLTWRGALVPEAYAAVVALVDAGVPVGLATGRAGGFADVLALLWPVSFAVAENGGYAVLRGGQPRFWDPSAERLAQRGRLDALVAEAACELPEVQLAMDADLRRVDVAWDLHERAEVSSETAGRLAALCRRHGARVLTSSIHLHAFYGDHDKAAMLLRLADEELDLEADEARSRCVFVGDSPNDQAGFTAFDRSVGVANVAGHADRLDPPPAFVTSRPGGFGFAELADRILAVR
ncbi:MAG: HAD family phosphatase [Mycobacterium sp.]|nr:HAD family phosphatase [Mycobacterium sp.]